MTDLTVTSDIDAFLASANNAAILPGLNLPAGAAVTPPAATGRSQTQIDNGFVRPTLVNPDGTYTLLDQDTIFICMANTGSGVTKGQVVYINGVNANGKPNVGLAKADNIAASYALGFALDSVADGAALRVLTIGRLDALTTPVGVAAGRVFLSDATAGSYSNTAPTAPGSFSCSLGYVRIADSSGVTGKLEARATTPVPNLAGALQANFNGQGLTPNTGVTTPLEVPYDCTILAWSIFADQAGSTSCDIWRIPQTGGAYPAYPPTIANSICSAAIPTLSSGQAVRSASLGAWTSVTLSKGDLLWFVSGVSTSVTWFQLSLEVVRR